MDIDVLIAARRPEWDRLDELLRRVRSLTSAEVDELVALYQRLSTDLSLIRSAAPDPILIGRLSSLAARARSAVVGTHAPAWEEVLKFFTHRFPAAVYRAAPWWVPTALVTVLVAVIVGWWVATHPEVQASIGTSAEIAELTKPGGQFETYYSSGPASSFAAQIWINNAWAAAGCLILGILILPVFWILWTNAMNVAVGGGLMAAAGRLDVFFGLIAPHGLLELTAVFVAAGTGLRLGWAAIDAGRRRRAERLAVEGRAAVGMLLGLACVLLLTAVIEAFVTPSALPTWARVGIGVLVELAFLWYVFVVGRKAALAGETGDLDRYVTEDVLPSAG
ncbi:MAG TPA: stage II sporulation protein M [Actinomycetes bacterium]|nr:stage II sporulation protein M [Actinomycetes bacterium]